MTQFSTKSKLHIRIWNIVAWIAPKGKISDAVKSNPLRSEGKITKKEKMLGYNNRMPHSDSFARKMVRKTQPWRRSL